MSWLGPNEGIRAEEGLLSWWSVGGGGHGQGGQMVPVGAQRVSHTHCWARQCCLMECKYAPLTCPLTSTHLPTTAHWHPMANPTTHRHPLNCTDIQTTHSHVHWQCQFYIHWQTHHYSLTSTKEPRDFQGLLVISWATAYQFPQVSEDANRQCTSWLICAFLWKAFQEPIISDPYT